MNITYKQFSPEYIDAVLKLQHTWVYENVTYGVVNETIEDMLGYANEPVKYFSPDLKGIIMLINQKNDL